MGTLKKIIFKLAQSYRPHPAALSLMRIGTGIIVLIDLCIRANDLTAHYTNSGIWPTNLSQSIHSLPGSWSLHAFSGSFEWVLFLFVLHAVLAICFVIGYKTFISNLLLWLLTISLHNRNIYILQGGDDLLRLLLFWGLFLNWNCYFSIDARKKAVKATPFLGGLGYLLLVASVYFFTVNLKNSSEWLGDGTAVYYALSLDQLKLAPVGDYLYEFPLLMKFATWLVYGTEAILPLLILWPSASGRLKFTAFVLIVLLHTGIALTLNVGLFFLINIVVALGLLPGNVIFKTVGKKEELPVADANLKTNKTIYLLWFKNAIAALVIVICLLINLGGMRWFPFELNSLFKPMVYAFRFDQYWGMFSPTIMKQDGWYVYKGIDGVGRQWDLKLNQEYVDFKKPLHLAKHYPSDRWRKLAENMQSDSYTFLRPRLCRYVLQEWNRNHPDKKMVTLILYFMEEVSLPDYKPALIEKKTFCFCNDI